MSACEYRRVLPPERLGLTRPLDSYTRRVWGCMPVSSAATEIMYNGLLRLSSVMTIPFLRLDTAPALDAGPHCTAPDTGAAKRRMAAAPGATTTRMYYIFARYASTRER